MKKSLTINVFFKKTEEKSSNEWGKITNWRLTPNLNKNKLWRSEYECPHSLHLHFRNVYCQKTHFLFKQLWLHLEKGSGEAKGKEFLFQRVETS